MQTFETYIASERERLTKEREETRAEIEAAQEKLAAIDTEMRAIAAYEAAKKDKSPKAAEGEKKPRKPRETGKRQEVFKLVGEYPSGVTVGELKDKLGIKGDKAGEQSLSNALSALKKSGQLTLDDGRYAVAAPV